MTRSKNLPDGVGARAATISAVLRDAGYQPIEPAILQDASPFIDLGGEDIRASLYFSSDRDGAELCLRPEFTIPVCRAYLASAQADEAARYSCAGPVFRFRAGEPDEFTQVGLESFGGRDTAAADAEILGLALEAVSASGAAPLAVTFGDTGLLATVLDGLRLPEPWQRRLKRGLDKGARPAEILAAAPMRPAGHAGVLAAMAGTDEAGARALVNDLLAIAGIASVGGRTASEIAERFLGQVAMRAAPPFGAEQQAVLDRFLSVRGKPDAAATELRALARDARLDLGKALDLFDERVSFLAVQGVDLNSAIFSSAFVRNLDYYTGFVFEARHRGAKGGPALAGGRYDRLTLALGSRTAVPAVGAAIWIDRLVDAGQGSSAQ